MRVGADAADMLRHRYKPLTVGAWAALAMALAILARGPVTADGPIFDFLVSLPPLVLSAPVDPDHSPVAVIALDDRSLFSPELRAYARTFMAPVWATLLDGVVAAGARTVAFDLIFAYSAEEFLPGFDRPFLEALARNRDHVVLARSASTVPAPAYLAALRYDPEALGFVELRADPDGVYRRVRADVDVDRGQLLPSFTDRVLRRARGPAMPGEVLLAPPRHLETIPTYAVVDVLQCAERAPEALKRVFAGKIVVVGGSLAEEDRKLSSGRFLAPGRAEGPVLHPCGLRRLRASSPDSRSVPGVFLHAGAIEAVVSERVPSIAPTAFIAGLAAGTAGIGASAGLFLVPWVTTLTVALVSILLIGAAALALARDFWIPLALPLGVLGGGPLLAYVVRYLVEERSRRRIQEAFCHYLSPTIVGRIAADPASLKLGGELREVTVMFADLSGFTELSRQVPPEVLTSLTNEYLGYIVEQVEATGGYVDKFIGDAVMAIWGAPAPAPGHARDAIRAALGAAERVRFARRQARARNELSFSVKIALNSGPAVVGNVGTRKRYNYTAVGETVNIASRLETVPGLYGCDVVVSAATAELAADHFVLRPLGRLLVKGVDRPVAVFEPLVERAGATPHDLRRTQRFAEALADYSAMRFADACATWDELAKEECSAGAAADLQPLRNPAATLADRAREFLLNPPPPSWDGVWILPSK